MFIPPLLHLGHGGFINLGIALTGIGSAHHHRAFKQTCFIQILLVLDGRGFAVASQLPFELIIDVFDKVVGNIQCNQPDPILGTVDLPLLGKLALEVGFLLLVQPFGDPIKPAVDGPLVHIQIRNALFIQQRGNSSVFYRTLHGIGMHDRTEFVGGLVVF